MSATKKQRRGRLTIGRVVFAPFAVFEGVSFSESHPLVCLNQSNGPSTGAIHRYFDETSDDFLSRRGRQLARLRAPRGGERGPRRLALKVLLGPSTGYCLFFLLYITVIVFAVLRVITAIFVKETLEVASNDAELMVQERMRKKQSYVACWGLERITQR